MKRLNACLAVGAMLFALVSAPLLHVHDRDDHHAGSLVHAHLPEFEHESQAGLAIEAEHSTEHGRSIDLFAVNTPAAVGYHAVAEFSEPVVVALIVTSRAVLSVQSLRAHSPPEQSQLPPRSPPLV